MSRDTSRSIKLNEEEESESRGLVGWISKASVADACGLRIVFLEQKSAA